MTTAEQTLAAWLGAHPLLTAVVTLLAVYGLFDLARGYGREVMCRVLRRPMYDVEGGFLSPEVVWLLLTAADAGQLTGRKTDDDGLCPDRDWRLCGAALPGHIAMPDQPSELLFLGWLVMDGEAAVATEEGRRARGLVESDWRLFRAALTNAAREARRAQRLEPAA